MLADPLRVLLLTARMSPAAGGLAVSVPSLAHSINAFPDIEMYVMGTRDPLAPEAAAAWGPQVRAFDTRGLKASHYAPGMGEAMVRLAPDLVDVQGLWTYPSLANLRYSRREGAPYIVTPRGMLDPWALRNSAWKKRIAAALFETAHLRGATALRATAEMEAQHFRNVGLTNPIAIVPNGIELPDLARRGRTPLRSALFLSRIHPKKGIDFLLYAWAALAADFPDWELVIAGIDENGHEAKLKSLAVSLNLPRLRFIGAIHGAAKQQLYRDADLFVLPTHTENFGIVVAEALAQETAVITTRNAPWAGLVTEGCGWWIDLDKNSLIRAMRDALSRPPGTLEHMGKLGRAWVKRDFAVATVAERMREVYLWASGKAPKPVHVHD